MDISVSLMYWPWFEIDEQVELGRLADELGFHSLWFAEGYGQDAVAMLGLMAGHTTRIRLGAGVMQIPARQPTATATAAATLDRASGGRMILGLGLSGPQVSEGWFGVPFTAPLRRTREYVEIVRQALSGHDVDYSGREWTIPLRSGGRGLGKPIKMLGRPVQSTVPIYLGVGGARTVEQAGEIADGWTPFLFSPEHAAALCAPLFEGIRRANRERSDVTVAPLVFASVHGSLSVARDNVRPAVALYLGGMGARSANFYVDLVERYGHGDSARACQDAYLAGDRAAAAAALSDELLDTVALVATPETLTDRLASYATRGVDNLIVVPFGDRHSLLRELARHLR